MNVEKNWLEEMVNSSDFEYFDGNEHLEIEAGQGKGSLFSNISKVSDVIAGLGAEQGKGSLFSNISKADVIAGQGKGSGNNVVYQAVPIITMPVEKRLLKASANPFTQYQQYNAVSNLFLT